MLSSSFPNSFPISLSPVLSYLFLSIWNRFIPTVVVIWALEQCFRMLGGRTRWQAFCINDGRWTLRERDEEREQICRVAFPLNPFFSASLCHLSPFVWIIDSKLSELDFKSQFPPQLEGKERDQSLPPQTTHSPLVFFSFYCMHVNIILVRSCGSDANFCTRALSVSWCPL